MPLLCFQLPQPASTEVHLIVRARCTLIVPHASISIVQVAPQLMSRPSTSAPSHPQYMSRPILNMLCIVYLLAFLCREQYIGTLVAATTWQRLHSWMKVRLKPSPLIDCCCSCLPAWATIVATGNVTSIQSFIWRASCATEESETP